MLHFTTGDMFEMPVDIRVNTVNCVGVMGAGVALAFKTRYPAMFRGYKKACDAGEVKPGTLNVWHTLTEWIINFPTKRHWRENSKYEDIEDGLKALRTYLDSVGRPVRVALPALGCGHGGLDWSRVSKLIERYLATVQADVFVFEPADSVRAGQQVASQKQRNSDLPKDLEPRIVRADEKGFPAPLRSIDVHALTVVGDGGRLMDPMVFITVSETPDAKEVDAAHLCVETLARTRVQLCFLVGAPGWRRLARLTLSRGADVLLWCVEPIRIDALQLERELKDGRITVASLADDHDVLSQRAYDRTRQAAIELSRALLITDSHPTWVFTAPRIEDRRLFFVRYGSSGRETDALLKVGACPIGRNPDSKTPNVAPIIAVLRPDASDDIAIAQG